MHFYFLGRDKLIIKILGPLTLIGLRDGQKQFQLKKTIVAVFQHLIVTCLFLFLWLADWTLDKSFD